MTTLAEPRAAVRFPKSSAWLPVVGLPVAVAIVGAGWPRWLLMWGLAVAMYAGLKWLSFASCTEAGRSLVWRSLGYLLFWPGMDAKSFLATSSHAAPPAFSEWLLAFAKVILGVVLLFAAVPLVDRSEFLAGWVGMAGIVFVIHFGVFHLLSLVWRRAGVHAPAIMNAPFKALSLSEFWGRRWNLAFRDLAHNFVFRPFVGRLGIAGATMAVFLASGLIHDVVISIPAGAGFGLPTAYFIIQGVGVLIERSRRGRRIGLGRGVVGWLFSAVVTLGPVCLLFHPPFVERVVVPMLAAFSAI